MPNEFFGWNRGANREAAERAKQNGGQIELSWRERLHGATTDDVQNILDTQLQKDNDRLYGAAAIEAGLTPYAGGSLSNYGESTQAFAAKIKKAQDAKTEAERKRGIKEKETAETKAHERTLALGQQGIDASNSQFAFTASQADKRRAHERQENNMSRRHERELSENRDDLTMKMSIMQNDLAERRMDYDRETQRMDKRQAAIAALMSGLGSLGGAFTL